MNIKQKFSKKITNLINKDAFLMFDYSLGLTFITYRINEFIFLRNVYK